MATVTPVVWVRSRRRPRNTARARCFGPNSRPSGAGRLGSNPVLTPSGESTTRFQAGPRRKLHTVPG
ncbi:hypothetical protein PJI17_18760 [Mycobacterium kansasii]